MLIMGGTWYMLTSAVLKVNRPVCMKSIITVTGAWLSVAGLSVAVQPRHSALGSYYSVLHQYS
jgi:hypothetical protein